jgi:hypothetical protein
MNQHSINICPVCERQCPAGAWPRDCKGAEFATVSHGLHVGDCDLCQTKAGDPQKGVVVRIFQDVGGWFIQDAADPIPDTGGRSFPTAKAALNWIRGSKTSGVYDDFPYYQINHGRTRTLWGVG